MNRGLFGLSFLLLALTVSAQKPSKKDYLITISTSFGEMKAILYDETPKHKANFVKLAAEGFYDSTTFHRVIKDFMIQGGDPNSKDDDPNNDGRGGPGYQIDAEFAANRYHKKGALAAARTNNPERVSSGSQFYIVQGKTLSEDDFTRFSSRIFQNMLKMPENDSLLQVCLKLNEAGKQTELRELLEKEKVQMLPAEMQEVYTTLGGTPHLDYDYSVFGEVIQGLDILDKIAEQPTGRADRPKEPIYMTIKVEEMKKKKITKLFGYAY